jgi:hypothetical protein
MRINITNRVTGREGESSHKTKRRRPDTPKQTDSEVKEIKEKGTGQDKDGC